MDLNYIENKIIEGLKNEHPQLSEEIIEEYVDLTFWGANWATYSVNKDIYILGIAESKYDFYYVGCNEKYEIQLISCALEVKKNKNRLNDFITIFNTDFKLFSEEADNIWRIIRKNIKEYFEKYPDIKLIEFQDHILNNEHLDKEGKIEKYEK